MKTIAFALMLLSVSSPASSTFYTLVSCDYEYIPEISQNKYIGVYRSTYGNLFTAYFDRYCPPTINQ